MDLQDSCHGSMVLQLRFSPELKRFAPGMLGRIATTSSLNISSLVARGGGKKRAILSARPTSTEPPGEAHEQICSDARPHHSAAGRNRTATGKTHRPATPSQEARVSEEHQWLAQLLTFIRVRQMETTARAVRGR